MDNTSVSSIKGYYEHTEKENKTLQEEEWFDLQPIEKKLCAYSLGLGIILLFVFIIIFEVI